jgi:uncharacterized protein YqgV (UPF0045/DUF77 family)
MINNIPVHKIVAVDVDDTILNSHNESFSPELGKNALVESYSPVDFKNDEALDDVREAFKILQEHGFTIVLYTARTNPEQDCNKPYTSAQVVQALHEAMQDRNIPYDYISIYKPVADIYIDDKGWHFRNWKQMINDLYMLGWITKRI